MSDFDRNYASEELLLLADYFELDPDTITEDSTYYAGFTESIYITADGETYVVLSDSDADTAFYDSVSNFIDDVGINGFSDYFKSWIHQNALDEQWFKDAFKEDLEFYANDIFREENNTYGNRLVQEMYDSGILDDTSFEDDEDGEPLYDEVLIDESELVDMFVADRMEEVSDYVEEMTFQMGKDWRDKVVADNNLLNIDKIVDELKSIDGRGPQLAYYDGVEHDLGKGYFAYRID